MNIWRSWGPTIAAASLLGCQSAQPVTEPQREPVARHESFFKGVNFTAERPAPYDSDAALETLRKLPNFGINAVALVPYAGARLGSPELHFPMGMERDEGIRRISEAAHEAGLRVVLKPQVWYRGGYPGEHDLETDEQLDAFFSRYGELVVHYARLAEETHADLFCIGVEFAKLTRHEERWRELIRMARTHYSGPLTYAANFGEEFESVAFWDALDYIGLDNYYPLPDDLSTAASAKRIEPVHQRFGNPVIFTEVGFSSYEGTHKRPWEDEPGGPYSDEAQAAGYEASFRGFHDNPWLAGMFWWKVGTNGRSQQGRSGAHAPWDKPAMDVLKDWYLKL
jgi:hypothetical protein